MSNTKVYLGDTEYDFDRCTKEQLAEYAAEIQRGNAKMGRKLISNLETGKVCIEAARVPRERKEYVAREIAEYVDQRSQCPYSDNPFVAKTLYEFAERYRKAVG